MLTQLISLMLLFLLVNMPSGLLDVDYTSALIFLTSLLLLLLYVLKKEGTRQVGQTAIQVQLILFLLVWNATPTFFQALPFGATGKVSVVLVLYLAGLFAYYWGVAEAKRLDPKDYALCQLRFLWPFVVLCWILTLLADLAQFSAVQELFNDTRFSTILSLSVFAFILIGFPFVVVNLWKCTPLQSSELRTRLEALCRRVNFRYSKIMSWDVFKHSLTAAILGVVPRLRYIVLTPRLLTLPHSAIEAVVAHEIGHSKQYHLLFYPLITSGIVIFGSIGFWLLEEPLNKIWSGLNEELPLPIQPFAVATAIFILSAGWMLFYIRYLFGFYSRLFERQADLYVFKAGLPADGLIVALSEIARMSGQDPAKPCWHHYSIQQRINTLQTAKEHPEIIERHDKLVKYAVIVYLVIFGIGLWCLLAI